MSDQVSPPRHVYYDNNLYRLPRGEIDAIFARERELSIEASVSPYVIKEVLSHLAEDRNSDSFRFALSTARRIREHSRMPENQVRMYTLIQNVISLSVFAEELDTPLTADLAYVLHLCTVDEPENWSDELNHTLAVWAKERAEMEAFYLEGHNEQIERLRNNPVVRKMFERIKTDRQALTLARMVLVKRTKLVDDELENESAAVAEDIRTAMAEADERNKRVRAGQLVDEVVQLMETELLPEVRERAIDRVIELFPVPFEHQYRNAARAANGSKGDANDFVDWCLCWQIPASVLKSQAPPVLITNDTGILDIAKDLNSSTIMSLKRYREVLGI